MVSTARSRRWPRGPGRVVLVVGVEVRSVMRSACLDEHPYDDTEEAADLGHLVMLG
jgi:hypothetical protein